MIPNKKNNFFLQICINFTVFLILLNQINSNLIQNKNEKTPLIKNILVNIFPGGKSHNFVLKELFDYSLKERNEGLEYKFHILVHNWDKDAWSENGPYKVFTYGDIELYDTIFNDALALVRKDPIFGYGKFHKAMIHIYEQFMESGILEELKKINFETMITDIPNFITKFLYTELKIKSNIYCSPPSLPNLFYGLFEMNPSYLPALGSTFTDLMTFKERFINSVYLMGMKVLFQIFQSEQAKTFKKYGYNLNTSNVFVNESFVMIQYPPGLFFNLALPPNFVRLNSITAKPAEPLTSPEINQFLNKFENCIYFSQGTIVKIVDFEKVINIFNNYKNYGFILSFKKDIISDEIIKKFPKNVLLVGWVKQNDLLGDSRVKAFITHGGTNSVSESIYHFKPMIVLGVTLDQVNTAAVVQKRNVGIVFNDSYEINSEKLIAALDEILKPEESNEYLKSVTMYGKILRSNKDPREEFAYWLRYGFKHGYDHLRIGAYTNYYFWELYNYDVMLAWAFIFLFVYLIIKKILVCVFCSCRNKKRKEKDE